MPGLWSSQRVIMAILIMKRVRLSHFKTTSKRANVQLDIGTVGVHLKEKRWWCEIISFQTKMRREIMYYFSSFASPRPGGERWSLSLKREKRTSTTLVYSSIVVCVCVCRRPGVQWTLSRWRTRVKETPKLLFVCVQCVFLFL
jgi:hypothetical protein